MPNRARLYAIPFAALCLPLVCQAAGADFSGAWTGWSCPPGARPSSGKCASFVLTLYQKEDQVCGSHLYATAGAGSLDEGGIPSFVGAVSGDAVDGIIESGRAAGTRIRVELKMTGDRLQWKRLESPDADYLLPNSMLLTKAKRGNMLHPVFAQRLSATCAATLDRALQEKQLQQNRQPAQVSPRPAS